MTFYYLAENLSLESALIRHMYYFIVEASYLWPAVLGGEDWGDVSPPPQKPTVNKGTQINFASINILIYSPHQYNKVYYHNRDTCTAS